MKMSREQEHLESIREMRSLMERSSRYLSLSGLAGVMVGVIALVGIAWLYYRLGIPPGQSVSFNELMAAGSDEADGISNSLLSTAAGVLVLSVIVEVTLASRKARKLGLPLWDATARRMFTALAVPVAGGGIYCLSLILAGNPDGLAAATLIFYGLGLVNAGKYAVPDVGRLGIAVFVTGLAASFFPGWGLLFWAIGFGIWHIVYGITIHFKHER
jgi:hypothetical protein